MTKPREYTEMTIQEALDAGYTRYGRDMEDHQILYPIEELLYPGVYEDAISHSAVIVAADKEALYFSFNAESILESIEDDIYGREVVANPEALVQDIKEKLDLTNVVKQLTEISEKHPYFYLTDIKLVKEKSDGSEI